MNLFPLVAVLSSFFTAIAGPAVLAAPAANAPCPYSVPDCACTADLIVEGLPACISASATPGAQTCTPHCNDADGCEGDSISCCPGTGSVTFTVNDWGCCRLGSIEIWKGTTAGGLGSTLLGSIGNGSGAGLNVPVGGNKVPCSTMGSVESKGEAFTITCHEVSGNSQTWHVTVKDKCNPCTGP